MPDCGTCSYPRSAGPKGSAEQEIYEEARPNNSNAMVSQIMRAMGISHVAKTVVGDDIVRGVSGGQKKRVTFGEVRLPILFSISMAFGYFEVQNSTLTRMHDGVTGGLQSPSALVLRRVYAWS
jgi:hypothetical protein